MSGTFNDYESSNTNSVLSLMSFVETLQPTDIPLLFKILRWPKNTENPPFNPVLDVIRLAFLNKSKNGLSSALLQSSDTITNEFADIMIGYITDSNKPTNQMLAVKAVTNIFSCDKGSKNLKFLLNYLKLRYHTQFCSYQ